MEVRYRKFATVYASSLAFTPEFTVTYSHKRIGCAHPSICVRMSAWTDRWRPLLQPAASPGDI